MLAQDRIATLRTMTAGCKTEANVCDTNSFRHSIAIKNLYHRLLLLIAGSTQKELASQIRYLKIEN